MRRFFEFLACVTLVVSAAPLAAQADLEAGLRVSRITSDPAEIVFEAGSESSISIVALDADGNPVEASLRIRGSRGQKLRKKRSEYVERTFAHCYDNGGMRRTHLREHPNILKRLLIHVAGFNLGLVMRRLFGVGTARGLQGWCGRVLALIWVIWAVLRRTLSLRKSRLAICGIGNRFE